MTNILMLDLGREYGGAEKVIENIFFYKNFKFNIHLVTLDNTKFASVLKNNTINNKYYFIKNDKKKIIKSLFEVKKYIIQNNIDIIHAHGVTSEIFGVILSLLTKRELVTTIHSRADFDTPSKAKGKIYCFLQKALLRFNKKYILVSDQLKSFFENDMKVNPRKLEVIVNGIKPLDKREKVVQNEFTIASIGRLSPVKAHINLLKGLLEVKKGGFKFKCIIAGNGELEDSLKAFVRENDLENEIEFYGFIDDIRDVLDKSDSLIIQSDMEGLPIIILETMSYEVPIIANEIGGIIGVINENNGIVMKSNSSFEIKEKIEFCLNNRGLIKQKACLAKKDFDNKYVIDKFIESYYKLYSNL